MKITVSMPDPLFREAEAAAKTLRVSRSKLVQTALREFLRERREAQMTASINRYLAKHGNELSAEDEALLVHGYATILREVEWKE